MINKTGIYRIRNKINNQHYYGSTSVSFRRRWNDHKSNLRQNCHDNSYLQHAWNKYGEDAFEFSIIHICPPDQCLYWEQILLDMWWDNCKNCYNITPIAGSQHGFRHSEQTKQKISKAHKTRGTRPPSQLGKKRRSETVELHRQLMIGNKYNVGRSPSQETRDRISKSQKGKVITQETKDKMSRAHKGRASNFTGHKHTEETKNKIRATKIGKKMKPRKIKHKNNNEEK